MKKMLLIIVSLMLVSCLDSGARKKKGLYLNLHSEPATLNPMSAQDGYAVTIHNYIFDSLLQRDSETYEWKPALAESYVVSEDKTKFIFKIRDGVKWHDGKPLTVEDIKYSFDIIFEDKFNTASKRPYLEGIKRVEVIDSKTVAFIAKDQYYANFDIAANMTIVPKHFYEDDKNKKNFNKVNIGTGSFKLEKLEKGKKIVLKRNKDWWGFKLDYHKEDYRYDKITFKFIGDKAVRLETFKKGNLDLMGMDVETYLKKTSGDIWGKSVFKKEVKNKSPKGYNFIGWNLKSPLFKSKKVRKALFHLVNRELMIDKFQFNRAVLAKSPVYPGSEFHNPNLSIYKFNPILALEILKSEGWSDSDGDNVLDKVIDGKKVKFEFTIIDPLKDFEKYLTIFKEDAKKAGVIVNIKIVEWNTFTKLLDERKFDAVRLAWGALVNWEPKQIWHSSSAKAGSNFISYNNPKVDKLIDEARLIHDKEKRKMKLWKIQELIANDFPYVWISFKPNTYYGYSNRVEMKQETLNYGIGTSKWTLKE